MAKQFNPFYKWLGFDDGVTHPNHFQLFGVKPNSEDPIGFRKQVHLRAKTMLATLEKMSDKEIGDRRALHTKLRRYVVKAHETLLDDNLRAAYLRGLRQKAREAKGSAKPLAAPPPQKGNGAQATSQTSKHQSMPTKKASGNPTIKLREGEVLPEEATVPMAIPLSKPGQHEVEDLKSHASSEVYIETLKSEEIVIKPGRSKQKISWLIPVLCLLMTLLCVAGIFALVMKFGNKLESVPVPALRQMPEVDGDAEVAGEKDKAALRSFSNRFYAVAIPNPTMTLINKDVDGEVLMERC